MIMPVSVTENFLNQQVKCIWGSTWKIVGKSGNEYFAPRVKNLALGVKKKVSILVYILGDLLAVNFDNRQEYFLKHFPMFFFLTKPV